MNAQVYCTFQTERLPPVSTKSYQFPPSICSGFAAEMNTYTQRAAFSKGSCGPEFYFTEKALCGNLEILKLCPFFGTSEDNGCP
jgi:hypothetical protein